MAELVWEGDAQPLLPLPKFQKFGGKAKPTVCVTLINKPALNSAANSWHWWCRLGNRLCCSPSLLSGASLETSKLGAFP